MNPDDFSNTTSGYDPGYCGTMGSSGLAVIDRGDKTPWVATTYAGRRINVTGKDKKAALQAAQRGGFRIKHIERAPS